VNHAGGQSRQTVTGGKATREDPPPPDIYSLQPVKLRNQMKLR
jgi:hypothetical protein